MKTCGSLGSTNIRMGPMVGHTTSTTAVMWAYFPTSSPKVKYWPQSQPGNSITKTLVKDVSSRSSRIVLTGLQANTRYHYQLLNVPSPLTGRWDCKDYLQEGMFKTSPIENQATEFTYIFGSGIREQLNKEQLVFDKIDQENPDFLIFNGDNIYLNNDEAKYEEKILRHQKQRCSIPRFGNVIRRFSTYSIWDDHDFGPNDSDGRYHAKVCSRMGFKHMWANPYYGDGREGVYSHFVKGNVGFFLVDDRYFKKKGQIYIGSKQMKWLKDGLLESHRKGIVFKIIVYGGTLRGADTERWFSHTNSRNELLKHIKDNQISGVLWHGGDCHKNQWNPYPMCPRDTEPQYDAFEIVSSGLTYVDRYTKITVNTKVTEPKLTYTFFEKGTRRTEFQDMWSGTVTILANGRLKHTLHHKNQDQVKDCQLLGDPNHNIAWPSNY